MKYLFYLPAILIILYSCTEESGGEISTDESGEELYMATTDEAGSSSRESTAGGNGDGQGEIQSGQITAGEWNDLENWTYWNDLQQKQDFSGMSDYWHYNLENRISVVLRDKAGKKAIDVPVQLLNGDDILLWESRTDNFGKAELWPQLMYGEQAQLGNLKLKIEGEVFEKIKFYSDGVNQLTLKYWSGEALRKLDLAFVVDATGSMSDELEYLKVELQDVIARVQSENRNTSINMGSVFYRDTEDEYLTKKSDFTSNIQHTISFIGEQRADGGGDFPEAVHTALKQAINNLQWSSGAASRLLFLLLDAPPHYEEQIIDEMHAQLGIANLMGIKIIPITASGIDKETEFLMRYLSIASNGTYVFVTDHSGIGGDHLEPSIGQYEVELLNDLLVRVINKYLE